MTGSRQFSKREGFLAAALPELPEKHRQSLSPFCELCERLNRVSHELMSAVRIQVGDPLQLLSACTYLRLLQALQATYIMVRLGLSQDAAVSLRTSFEALVLLRACRLKPELAFSFVSSDDLEQLKLANANIARLEREGSGETLLDELRKGKAELERRVAESGAKKVSTHDLANKTGLGGVYETMWRIVSKYAHISPRALEEFVTVTRDQVTVNYGPEYREAERHLAAVAEFSLIAQSDFGQTFSVESGGEHGVLAERFRYLVKAANQ